MNTQENVTNLNSTKSLRVVCTSHNTIEFYSYDTRILAINLQMGVIIGAVSWNNNAYNYSSTTSKHCGQILKYIRENEHVSSYYPYVIGLRLDKIKGRKCLHNAYAYA